MNKTQRGLLFLILIFIFSLIIKKNPLREAFNICNSNNSIINQLNSMYKSDKGIGFRALERCSAFYTNDEAANECLRKEIEGPHGGDESIINASTTWLNYKMKEAHFYSDIYFQSSETDVFLLLPGNQKYDCDFVQDAGFNGCGQNIPDCEGDADKLAQQYLESCSEGDDYSCHNPYICNFKDQNLLIDTYNKIIENIRKPGSKYNKVPIKEPQRQSYWDQGGNYWNQKKTEKGKYGQPIAIGFLFDEAPKSEIRKDDPLSRVIGSKIFANDFGKKIQELYTNCQNTASCPNGLELPVVAIHRKKDFSIEFIDQNSSIIQNTPNVTCNPDSIIPKCTPETAEVECKKIIDTYKCGDKMYVNGCSENNFCKFKAI